MKVQQLFDELGKLNVTSKSDFEASGMINYYNTMKYGFFPLGWGILTENNKISGGQSTDEIAERSVMVLGNDFGTVDYADKNAGQGELSSTTIRNLLSKEVNLDVNTTFFTNFYLGVRKHPNATMINRVEQPTENYTKTCYKFFTIQLHLLNPSVIICLGHDVKNALIDSKTSFGQWQPKSKSIRKIYNDNDHIIESELFGNRKFVLIPHPCDLRNFNSEYRSRLNETLNACNSDDQNV